MWIASAVRRGTIGAILRNPRHAHESFLLQQFKNMTFEEQFLVLLKRAGVSSIPNMCLGVECRAYGARDLRLLSQPFRAGLTFGGRPSGP
jgi:hypothetical protein